MASLTLSQIRKSFGNLEVLHGIDLSIEAGEFVVFVGPSGCGKSTLLRTIAGLEEVSGGRIEIGGNSVNDVTPAKRGLAMVFQSYALYPHMNVYDNMAFGLKLAKVPKSEIRAKVMDAARMLQLEPFLERYPRQLSGGQRQRVAIGRAVTRDPKVFLFDEPLSNLDASLRVATRLEIANLKRQMPGTTMIYVTHDQVEAMTLADRIVVMNGGRIEQVGSPLELYSAPRNLFVAQFIGSPSMNILDVSASETSVGVDLAFTGNSPLLLNDDRLRNEANRIAKLGIRPEHLSLANTEDAQISGRVLAAEELGDLTILHLDLGAGSPVQAKVEPNTRIEVGKLAHLTVSDDAMYLFDKNGDVILR